MAFVFPFLQRGYKIHVVVKCFKTCDLLLDCKEERGKLENTLYFELYYLFYLNLCCLLFSNLSIQMAILVPYYPQDSFLSANHTTNPRTIGASPPAPIPTFTFSMTRNSPTSLPSSIILIQFTANAPAFHFLLFSVQISIPTSV